MVKIYGATTDNIRTVKYKISPHLLPGFQGPDFKHLNWRDLAKMSCLVIRNTVILKRSGDEPY